jgi:(p)ppGpp synthase/HD superfamily hydrolase
MAKSRRIAERAHRGQLYAGGGLFVDHLQRVADDVAQLGGTEPVVQAAWLHNVPAAGVDVRELLTRGVPAAVVRVVNTVQHRPTARALRLLLPVLFADGGVGLMEQ